MKFGRKTREALAERRKRRNTADMDYQFLKIDRERPHYVFVSGQFHDLNKVPGLEKELFDYIGRCSGENGKIILDLGNVERLNTAGIAAMVRAKRKAQKRGLEVYVSNLNRSVKNIFEITRLKHVFQEVPATYPQEDPPKIVNGE